MKTALITGASSGLGAALVERLITDGYTVAGVARSHERLAAAQARHGEGLQPLAADLAQTDAVADLARRAETVLGGAPDVLIHNAGVFSLGSFTDLPPARIAEIQAVNCLAPMLLTQALLPGMQARGSGRIIVIASVAGTHGLAGQAAYCASKHGLVGFADALSAELRGSGILVHTLCPGGIDTPLWRSGAVSYPGDLDQAMQPKEIADLVAFLLTQPAGTRYRRVIMFPDCEWH